MNNGIPLTAMTSSTICETHIWLLNSMSNVVFKMTGKYFCGSKYGIYIELHIDILSIYNFNRCSKYEFIKVSNI